MSLNLRPESRFLLKFLGLIALFFALTAPKVMNEGFVEPFTALVARAGGLACRVFESDVRTVGTTITSPRFTVNIRNGCNGLETSFLFGAAVLAFPASLKSRILGLLGGLIAIQLVNLARIAALFTVGVHWPGLFARVHTVIAPALVILAGVLLFLVWADRFAAREPLAIS